MEEEKMATKITPNDIKNINELYLRYKTYAEVARQTGFSAGTVKKYIIKDFAPVAVENIKHVSLNDIPSFSSILFKGIDNYGDLCILSEEEKQDMEQLWKEMSI